MRKQLLSFLLLGCSVTTFGQSYVARWDFNSIVNDANTATGSNIPVNGIGSFNTIGGVTNTYVTGNPNDLNTTDNSGFQTTTYPAQGIGQKTAGVQFDISTLGFNEVQLSFYQRLSNTAANTWVLQYTLDNTGVSTGGNVVWVDATMYTFTPAPTGTGDTWYLREFDFSLVVGLNNNANAGFRMVSDFDPVSGTYLAARSTSTYSSAGTSRFDLVTLKEASGTASIVTASNFQIVNETAGTVNVPVTFANANNALAEVVFEISGYSSGSLGTDFNWTIDDTLVIPAGFNGVVNFPITVIDDTDAERTETVILKMKSHRNALVSASQYYQIIYVKDNDYVAPVGTNELNMNLLTNFSNGPAGTNSAEIVVYDSSNYRLYVANSIAAKLDIVDFSNPSSPALINSISVTPYGNINSVAVHNGVIALAIENANAQLNGSVVFMDQNGVFISQVETGAMPDMITFNKDFTKILTANEGEPNSTYSVDPEGSVTIIDLTPGYAALTNANATTIALTQFNGQESALLAQGIRIFSTSASVAQDLEPEYIAISDDNTKAYVSLQENNAMLVIDIATAVIEEIRALGYSDYSTGNGMDASDQTGQVLITSLPVKGAYMPDAMAYSTIGGQGYVFTANEGDSREFGSVIDAGRISTLNLDATAFPDQLILKNNRLAGRLSGLRYSGDTDNDGDLDEIHVMGGRSFSIWNAATGALVFDSKDLIEQIVAAHPVFGAIFNASNSIGVPSFKNRSDDKGPEPEGVTTAIINGDNYLFVALERVGGAMIFNVNDPNNPVYVGYENNRSTTSSGPDLGAEGMIYISAEQSPNGNSLLILANEVSSTLSIYQVNTCAELAGAEITAATTTLCQGESTTLTIQGATGSNYQWYFNNQIISGETSTNFVANQSGEYEVFVQNSVLACNDTSTKVQLTVNSLPVITASASQSTVCAGTQLTLNGNGGNTYSWNNGVTNGVAFAPLASGTYTVTGTNLNGCSNTSSIPITVNALPNITASSSQSTVCAGTQITLNGGGGNSYTWNNGVSNGVAFAPASSGTYTVTGTNSNGCTRNATISITVNSLPNISATASQNTVCSGDQVTLSGSGGNSYTWNNGVNNGIAFIPSASGTYTVTGTNSAGCLNTASVAITVNSIPNITANASQNAVCAGTQVTLSGNGGNSYSWNNGVNDGIAFIPTTSANYTVVGEDVNGCENTASVYLTVHELPNVVANVTDNEICEGQNVVFYGSGAQSYTWNNSIVNGLSVLLSNSGTFEVIGIDANGCSAMDEVSVVVNAAPSISLGEDTTICSSNAPLDLSVIGTYAGYSWNTGASTAMIQVNQTGSYALTVTAANGCTDSDEILVIIDPCLGLEDLTNTINVYPNPTSGMVTMNFGKEITKGKVELIDAQGRVVLVNEVNGENHTFDISSFATGIYTVVLIDEKASQQVRIIKE